jgi:hypothetical protein
MTVFISPLDLVGEKLGEKLSPIRIRDNEIP